MKKLLLLLVLLAGSLLSTNADCSMSVENITIPQGGTGTIEVMLDNDDNYTAFQATLELPDGIQFVSATKSSRLSDNHILSSQVQGNGSIIFACIDLVTSADISGNSGLLFTIEVKADDDAEVGAVLNAKISGIELKQNSGALLRPLEVPFTIEVTAKEDYVTLNENSLNEPEATTETVRVKVIRPIKAGIWNTICLPFGMNTDKLKAAFGDDYELAQLKGIEVVKNGNYVNEILVEFEPVTKALVANRPYIIKVTKDKEEFWVEEVKINPRKPIFEITEENEESGYSLTIAAMTGTYVNETVVPAKSLVISNNSFWYSVGKTSMKGFRAYFTFHKVLSSYEDAAASARVKFTLTEGSGEPTAIDVDSAIPADGKYYNLQGQIVTNPARGIYIKNGKKVVVK